MFVDELTPIETLAADFFDDAALGREYIIPGLMLHISTIYDPMYISGSSKYPYLFIEIS